MSGYDPAGTQGVPGAPGAVLVRSVAGRQGDVLLTIADIAGGATAQSVTDEATTRANADATEAATRAAAIAGIPLPSHGLLGDLPSPVGLAGRSYLATDTKQSFETDGATWYEILTAPGAAKKYGQVVSVLGYAKGDGVADDTAAIVAALAAAAAISPGTLPDVYGGTRPIHPTVVFPAGIYNTTAAVVVPAGVNVILDSAAVIRATAVIAGGLLTSDPAVNLQHQTIQGGVVDCNALAQDGVVLQWFAHVELLDTQVINPTRHHTILGTAAATGTSYEGIIRGLNCRRTRTTAAPVGSYGLWLSRASDCHVTDTVLVGTETCVRLDTGNNTLVDVHGWNYGAVAPPVTCFDNNDFGNVFISCYADTPSLYGFRLRNGTGVMIGCRVYISTVSGTDNAVVAVHNDSAVGSFVSVGLRAVGGDATHRLKADYDGDVSQAKILGGTANNIVTQRVRERLQGLELQSPFAGSSALVITNASSGTAYPIAVNGFDNVRRWGVSYKGETLSVGLILNTDVVTAGFTLAADGSDTIVVNSAIGDTMRLPDPTTCKNKQFNIKNKGAGNITVNCVTGQNIDNVASEVLAQWAVGRYRSDGTQWLKL